MWSGLLVVTVNPLSLEVLEHRRGPKDAVGSTPAVRVLVTVLSSSRVWVLL